MAGISSIRALAAKVIKTVESKEGSIAKVAENVNKEISPIKVENAIKAIGESSKSIFDGAQKLQGASKMQDVVQCLKKDASKALGALEGKEQETIKGLPKFLYHMTSEKNYKKILKTGEMYGSKIEQQAYENAKKAGHAINAMPGKYMVSKNNFVNNWMGTRNPEVFGDIDIGESLLDYASQGKGKMVAIQVPTSSLDLSKLRFRPYTEVCEDLERAKAVHGSSKITCEGLPLNELSKYINKGPVEFVYQGEMPASLFTGTTSSKTNMAPSEIVKNLFG